MTRAPGRPIGAWAVGWIALLLLVGLGACTGRDRPDDSPSLPTTAWAETPDGSRVRVDLPDSWRLRGERAEGDGVHVLQFALDGVPGEPWAACFERISATREVWLNGALIEARTPQRKREPHPAVIVLPTPLLRAGSNELRIAQGFDERGGLSAPHWGPAAALHAQHEQTLLRTQELPRIVNIAVVLQSLFMVLIYCWRRAEVSMGFFGLMSVLAALSNYARYTSTSLLPSAWTAWWDCAVQIGFVSMLMGFALSLQAHRGRTAWRWAVWGPLLVLPGVAGLASLGWGWPQVRALLYPVLALLAAGALAWAAQAARERREAGAWLMGGALALAVAAYLHDLALELGWLPITGAFWLPWAMPVAMTVYALIVLRRLAGALNESEQLNVELEQRVALRTQALEVANAAKSRFLAAASHDLRQPVAAISLMAGLLREQLDVPHLRQLGSRIYDTIGALETMLKGLLDLSRLESDAVRVHLAPVALQQVFDAVALHEAPEAERKGLRLRLRPTDVVVLSDAVLLEQVLRNLVGNAVRYTERGGVLVAARRDGDRAVRLQVWDTGCGIADAEQARIYDEFYQVGNRARDRERGLGLGLSIVRRGVDRLGHTLSLRSQLGRGSCFTLRLPRGVAPLPSPVVQPAQSVVLRGCQLVLVEDDHAVRESLTARLQAWGAQVLAVDSLAALQAAASQHPAVDLLITDERLADASGLDVIAWARAQWGRLPALVVTGDTAPQDLNTLAASGVPVLHKPFRAEALQQAIERAVAAAPAAREAAGAERRETQPASL